MIVYQHIRLDNNEVFYIGIGKNISRAYRKDGRNNIWNSIIKKTDYRVEIVFENLTKNEACDKERELISLHGKIFDKTGTLANLTVGGEILLGNENPMYGKGKPIEIDGVFYPCIKEASRVLKKHEKTIRYRLNSDGFPNYRKLFDPEVKPRLTEDELKVFFLNKKSGTNNPMYGRKHSKETKEKLRNDRKGKHISEEHKEKIRKTRNNRVPVSLVSEKEIKRFESKSEAARFLKVDISKIYRSIKYGYKCRGYKVKEE